MADGLDIRYLKSMYLLTLPVCRIFYDALLRFKHFRRPQVKEMKVWRETEDKIIS